MKKQYPFEGTLTNIPLEPSKSSHYPFMVEFTGTPEAGKTTCILEVKRRLEAKKLKVTGVLYDANTFHSRDIGTAKYLETSEFDDIEEIEFEFIVEYGFLSEKDVYYGSHNSSLLYEETINLSLYKTYYSDKRKLERIEEIHDYYFKIQKN